MAFFAMMQAVSVAAETDPLKIPDSDEGVPGSGPLRRTDWFRGVWRSRRESWLDRTEEQKGSVVFLGDSITEGWGDDFKGAFGKLKVANRGIRGDTSRGLLLRLKEDVIDLEPRAVVLMIGANDLAEKSMGETVFGNVKLIVEALKAHNPKMPIVLCETFPCAPDEYRPVAEIRKINSLYEKMFAGDAQVTLAKTYSLFAGGDGASLPKYLPDRVHPNAVGYAKWAGAMRPIFAELGFAEDTTPDPHAWIHFDHLDRQVALFHNFHLNYTDRREGLESRYDVLAILRCGRFCAGEWSSSKGNLSYEILA